MPKEVIYLSHPREGESEPVVAVVGWQPDCWVQLRLGTVDGLEAHEALGVVDFDRQQINKLIRVLRRARDQAYGRDE